MHCLLPFVGMAARVSPIEQHLSRAAVQLACENNLVIILVKKQPKNLFFREHEVLSTTSNPLSVAIKVLQ
jgi:hypothetical protein